MSSTVEYSGGLYASRSDQIVIIQIFFISLSTLTLVLRQMTRLMIQHRPMGADDWVITLAWVFSLAFSIDVSVRKY